MSMRPPLPGDLDDTVARALQEDVGTGDLTARLVPDQNAAAVVRCREKAVLCGTAWFARTFEHIDANVQCQWLSGDGEELDPGQEVCRLRGAATALLGGERTALNFLQLLSGTATLTREYVKAVAGTGTAILDTGRKA